MMSAQAFADDLKREISQAYAATGNGLGWRFLYSPTDVLEKADVALIGLNPGGSEIDPDHAEFAMAKGSAYRDEVWPAGSKLQGQVLALFERLKVPPERVLAGNLVPFRSPSWSTLSDKPLAIRFGLDLWRRVLDRARPSIVVSMGKQTNDLIPDLLGVRQSIQFPVGWGSYTARRGQFSKGIWIGLPHLSQFAIMKRESGREHLDRLFEGVAVE